MPATLTRACAGCVSRLVAASTDAGSVMSVTIGETSHFPAAKALNDSASQSSAATRHPVARNASAQARPIPFAAPAITTRGFSAEGIGVSFRLNDVEKERLGFRHQ